MARDNLMLKDELDVPEKEAAGFAQKIPTNFTGRTL